MRTGLLIAAFATLAAVPASAQVTVDSYVPLPTIALPPELDRVLRDYERAWQAGDETALAALFTEDGFVPTRFGWVRGRPGIRSVYESSQGALRLRAIAFAVEDTVGYIVGAYNYADPPAEIDGGKFVLVLRREPGARWLIAADLDGANRP